LQFICTFGSSIIPLDLHISGELAKDPSFPGLRTEDLRSWIPNMVLYVDRDPNLQLQTGYEYSMVLVYSCKEHYLFHDVFESVQVFSRIPTPGDEKIEEMLQKGRDLGLVIDRKNVVKREQAGCKYPESILPGNFLKA